MTIPFIDLFKKLTGRFAGATAIQARSPARPVPIKKPSHERLGKTILPHATRSFSPPDPFRAAAGAASSANTAPSLQLGPRSITASSAASRSRELPPALARALEPKLERAISLQI